MFPTRYFANRMFAPRYFPKVGQDFTFNAGGDVEVYHLLQRARR